MWKYSSRLRSSKPFIRTLRFYQNYCFFSFFINHSKRIYFDYLKYLFGTVHFSLILIPSFILPPTRVVKKGRISYTIRFREQKTKKQKTYYFMAFYKAHLNSKTVSLAIVLKLLILMKHGKNMYLSNSSVNRN